VSVAAAWGAKGCCPEPFLVSTIHHWAVLSPFQLNVVKNWVSEMVLDHSLVVTQVVRVM
jgi:hypothetical protein